MISNNLYFYLRTFVAVMIQKIRVLIKRAKGYDIDYTTILERNLNFDRLYPQGIHIGKYCLVASGVTILSHDHCKRTGPRVVDCLLMDTVIGNRCFLAVNSTILGGVKIGDEVIVGAGSVVTKDVPSNCIVAGNPARIIRKGIKMSKRAELLNWNPREGFIGTEV